MARNPEDNWCDGTFLTCTKHLHALARTNYAYEQEYQEALAKWQTFSWWKRAWLVIIGKEPRKRSIFD